MSTLIILKSFGVTISVYERQILENEFISYNHLKFGLTENIGTVKFRKMVAHYFVTIMNNRIINELFVRNLVIFRFKYSKLYTASENGIKNVWYLSA